MRILENKLKLLKEDLTDLVASVRKTINDSMEALKNRDENLCKRIIEGDDEIDFKSIDLERKVLQIIATQHPQAEDLRIVSSILFINIDLERMADHCVDIAEETLTIVDKPHLKPLIDLPRMKDTCIEMLDGAIESFLNKDVDLAMKIIEKDDILDKLNWQIFRELLTYMMEDPRNIRRANALILISQHYERIGDHITNICERTVYIVEGKMLKTNPHQPRY